jgi:2-methylcitrate dehydratase PrpD
MSCSQISTSRENCFMHSESSSNQTQLTISQEIASFAARLSFDDLPLGVVEQAKLLVLDAIGIAFASTTYDFAEKAISAISSLGEPGNYPLIGTGGKFSIRDTALLTGVLVHGLDYDDTHIESVCHTSSSALPTALLMASRNRLSCRDFLAGFVLATEVAARIGMAAEGAFHEVGFHPTGIANAFGSATAAARLEGGSVVEITRSQGVVGSLAGGLMQFAEDGSWTKRLHPGQAAANGITAAMFGVRGWPSPEEVYEGQFGLFRTHLQQHESNLAKCTGGLGDIWELSNCALKPYPVCHFIHAFADAALALVDTHQIVVSDIERINAYIHPTEGSVVSYPEDRKQEPVSEYEAKFSLPFVVACTIVQRRFGLAELREELFRDPAVIRLAHRVRSFDDEKSDFPSHYPARLEIQLKDGKTFTHNETINRGASDRPLSVDDICEKYQANMGLAVSGAIAEQIQGAVLGLERIPDVLTLQSLLCDIPAGQAKGG